MGKGAHVRAQGCASSRRPSDSEQRREHRRLYRRCANFGCPSLSLPTVLLDKQEKVGRQRRRRCRKLLINQRQAHGLNQQDYDCHSGSSTLSNTLSDNPPNKSLSTSPVAGSCSSGARSMIGRNTWTASRSSRRGSSIRPSPLCTRSP